MPEEIKAIDIMNYAFYCVPEERRKMFFSKDWAPAFQTTFRAVGSPEKAMEYFGHPSLEEMLKEMDEAGYEKVIITAVKQWSWKHNEWITNPSIELIKELVDKSNGKVVGGVGYDPLKMDESLLEIDKAIKEYGFKYIYFHPQGFNLPPNDKRFYPAYVKAFEYDVPIGFQAGHSAEVLPSEVGRPIYIDEVAIQFPTIRFILSHTGWPWVDEWIAMIWKHPNVYGDISAYPARTLLDGEKIITFMNGGRGRSKVLFGTNGLGLKTCKDQFMELDIREDTKRMVLRENAIKLFKL